MKRINWKYLFLIVFDLVIFVYLIFAMTSWNKPDESHRVCSKVDINIEDQNENGFLKTAEVKALLEKKELYPLNQSVEDINTRGIEEILMKTAFVKTAQCYITTEGHVCIALTQRTPIMRVKADNGEDYYIDDNGGVMPNSQYTADMPIVTGSITRQYACQYISILANVIMKNDFWHNQVEQINVLPDRTIEIIPRVGDHIINIGSLPNYRNTEQRNKAVTEFVQNQLHRIDLFYKYGLSQAGWNKYSYISIEFANQVICTNRNGQHHDAPVPIATEPQQTQQSDSNAVIPAAEQKKSEENTQQSGESKKADQKPKSTEKKADQAKKSDDKKTPDKKSEQKNKVDSKKSKEDSKKKKN